MLNQLLPNQETKDGMMEEWEEEEVDQLGREAGCCIDRIPAGGSGGKF